MSNVIGNIILEGAFTSEDAVVVSDKPNKRLVAEGTLQDMDVENRNKRIYAKADLAPEVTGPRIQELIKTGNMKGHAGHPLSDDLVVQQTIDPKLVCVKFLKIWVDGNLIKGQFKGTNGAYGQEFDDNLRDGELPAFSLRALGSIENRGGKAYVKNIKIITWDYVIFPSHKKAYTDKIVSESAIIDGVRRPLYESEYVVPNNDPGRIITLTNGDAKTVLNRLQRESANVSTIIETFDGIYDRIDLINEHTLILTDRFGDRTTVNLENHVDNIIKNYVFKY